MSLLDLYFVFRGIVIAIAGIFMTHLLRYNIIIIFYMEEYKVYTKEQNLEIERVCKVFSDYIKQNPYFDVVWSNKLGYVYLGGISSDKERIEMAPIVLRSGSELCEEIIHNIAEDVLQETGVYHEEFSECSETEREKIKDTLQPYMKQLPEYETIVQELFLD